MADQGDVSIGLQKYITGSSKKTAVSSVISPIALVIDEITGIVSGIGNIMFIVATVYTSAKYDLWCRPWGYSYS